MNHFFLQLFLYIFCTTGCLMTTCLQAEKPLVIAHLRGQFGNQLFQIAASVSLAMEHHASVCFPDFANLQNPHWQPDWDLRNNYNYIFHRINHEYFLKKPSCVYIEPDIGHVKYTAIPYTPNMEIVGYFLSEKYFYPHRDFIKQLFAPPKEIEDTLQQNFSEIVNHPKSVGIHVRTGYPDYKKGNFSAQFYSVYLRPDLEYYKKAILLFDSDSLFVVFSDNIGWCKKNFKDIPRQFIFIENQDYLHDFYLLTLCKNAIIANSSLGWWGAYLNKNINKKIVCRTPFFGYPNENTNDLLCPDWIQIAGSSQIPFPTF